MTKCFALNTMNIYVPNLEGKETIWRNNSRTHTHTHTQEKTELDTIAQNLRKTGNRIPCNSSSEQVYYNELYQCNHRQGKIKLHI